MIDYTIKGTPIPKIPVGIGYRCAIWTLGNFPIHDNNSLTEGRYVSFGTEVYKGETYVLIDKPDYKGTMHYMVRLEDLNKIKNNERMKQITAKQAQKIFNTACPTWKETLANKWSRSIILDNDISISEEFYKEMIKACTKEQNDLFDEIFGAEYKVGDYASLVDKEFSDGSVVKQICAVRESDGWLGFEGMMFNDSYNYHNPKFVYLRNKSELEVEARNKMEKVAKSFGIKCSIVMQ